jgi:hypothetical protein
MIAEAMRTLLQAAARWLADRAAEVESWAEGIESGGKAAEFVGLDLVGIDFSTSIQSATHHVIRGWDNYCRQRNLLHPNHGVWPFGVNAIPFPLTPRPVPPQRLPGLCVENFQQRGCGRGLIEYGSAFYDYFLIALAHVHELGIFDEGRQGSLPITITLLCDGCPNGGVYRAEDVRPLIEPARRCGVRFLVVGFVQEKYLGWMLQFRESLGLTREELQVICRHEEIPDGVSIGNSFDFLSRF